MKHAKKGLQTIVLVVLIAALVYITGSHYMLTRPEKEEQTPPPSSDMPVATPPVQTENPDDGSPQPSGETIGATLAVTGDMVIHAGLNHEAQQSDGSYDYTDIFQGVAPYVQNADYAVSTLETTFAGTAEYTGYPQFKSPDDLAVSIKELGFDLLNTGSNHCMDSYKGGLVRTLKILDEQGIAHVGTYNSQEARDENNGITMVDVNGISIAFLSYTYGTNGIPVDHPYTVNIFYEDYMTNLSVIDYDMLDADMAAARDLGADLIAVFMHWGLEYQTTPNAAQYELADYLFTQGADLILGGHTHVPQPMELREVTDLDGNKKTGYICYCLGNLVSCQVDLNTNLSAVVNIELEKDLGSGEAYIKDVSYVPLYMMNLYDYDVTDAGWRYRLLDLYAAMEEYESGSSEYITESMYKSLKAGLETIHSIMGEEFDARVKAGE